jgi:hypothetical protein
MVGKKAVRLAEQTVGQMVGRLVQQKVVLMAC